MGRRLQRTWVKTGREQDRRSLQRHMNSYKLALKKSKRAFVQHHIKQAGNHSSALFKITSALSRDNCPSSFVPEDAQLYCEQIATFFSLKIVSLRTKVDSASPNRDLAKALEELSSWGSKPLLWQTEGKLGTSDSRSTSTPVGSFSNFVEVTVADVDKILKALGPSSSILDPLPTPVVKTLSPFLLPDLTTIINSSLRSGEVPQAWKHGIVTPLLKKAGEDQAIPQNLRPVSQLCLLPRLTEHIVTQQLQKHLEQSLVLHDFQSGFRPERGTELAVADIREKLLWCTDRSHPTLLILLDLSAAFDTVDHAILLQQLSEIAGLEGVALKWMKSFLQDRVQSVRWGECRSAEHKLSCGVPQGSSLSPLLFNIYMRPLASLLERIGLRFQMYADDTQVLVDLHDTAGEKERLVSCLVLVEEWMRVNKLCLNSAKTELLYLEGHRGAGPQAFPWPESWGATPTPVSCSRDLGIKLSHNLDAVAHIATTVKTCHHKLNILARLFPLLSLAQKKQLYQAHVGSRLNYGLFNALGASKKTLSSLQKVQNRAIRLILGLTRRDHISEPRLMLGWLSMEDSLKWKICCWIWKARHNQGPRYMQRWFDIPRIDRARRPLQRGMAVLPRFKKSRRGGVTLAYKGGSLWNTLPPQLRASPSLASFKQNLKVHLLKAEAERLVALGRQVQLPPITRKHTTSAASEHPLAISAPQRRPLRKGPDPIVFHHPVVGGLTSPPLPRRDNAFLIDLTHRNKIANLAPDGTYRPRMVRS